MNRGLNAAALAAIRDEVPLRTCAVELDWPGAPARLNGSPISLWIEGNEFLGVGALGSISIVEETTELRAQSATVTLSGIPRDAIAVALTQSYQGRRGTIWEVPLSRDTYQPVSPIVIWRGRMDQMDVQLGETASVSVRIESRLADARRARNNRYTDEEQQRHHPGDTGFRFVPATNSKEIAWPAASYFERR